jgi:hypothetical protein
VLLAEAQRRGLRLDQYELQRPSGGLVVGTPSLSVLRRYRLLVWCVRETNTGLQTTPGVVADYVALGGHLWVLGNTALVNLAIPPTPNPYGYAPGELGFDVLHLESERDGDQIIAGGIQRAARSLLSRRVDGLAGAIPTASALGAGWPALPIARAPFNGTTEGVPGCEGMTTGYVHGARPGRFDTLYTYFPNGERLTPPVRSGLLNAPCAFRYEGPLGGKVLAFAFPVDWFGDAATDSLGRSAIRWFLDEERP